MHQIGGTVSDNAVEQPMPNLRRSSLQNSTEQLQLNFTGHSIPNIRTRLGGGVNLKDDFGLKLAAFCPNLTSFKINRIRTFQFERINSIFVHNTKLNLLDVYIVNSMSTVNYTNNLDTGEKHLFIESPYAPQTIAKEILWQTTHITLNFSTSRRICIPTNDTTLSCIAYTHHNWP